MRVKWPPPSPRFKVFTVIKRESRPQIHNRYEGKDISKHKRNLVIAGGVTLSVIVSPVVAAVTVGKSDLFYFGPKHVSVSCAGLPTKEGLVLVSFQALEFPSCSPMSMGSSLSHCAAAEGVECLPGMAKECESSLMMKMTTLEVVWQLQVKQ